MKTPTRSRFVGAAVLTILLAPVVPAIAAESPIDLSLRPVGSAGAFFDLNLRPGETRDLGVEIGNHGAADVTVRTGTADVYTIINGGFGARLRSDPGSGATTWLTYPTDVFTLAVGRTTVRPLSVTVADGAPPGQYISSVIAENDVPITGSGALQLDQVVRLAMTVRITVPGPLEPSLSIGAATHKIVTGVSVVSVAVANTGNQRLDPRVSFAVLDATGIQVGRTSFQMGAFYAHTDTFIEVPLTTVLMPGRYTVRLGLDDATAGARASNDVIPLVIAALSVPPAITGAAGPGLTGVNQGGSGGPQQGLLILVAGIAAGLVAALGFGLLFLALHRRRQRK